MNKKKKSSTKELIGIEKITEHSIKTRYGDLVYFLIQPSNLSVLSESAIGAKVYSLKTVLQGVEDIEMLCLNSKENFDENKANIKKRMDQETNPVIRKLLELDSKNMDRLQVTMATAREFLIAIRLQSLKETDNEEYLTRIQKTFKDLGFTVKLASIDDLKRVLSVYFEQNVTTEKYDDYDGERWMI